LFSVRWDFSIFSCTKNTDKQQVSGSTKPIDSLAIPLRTGTWWKYQRNDSSQGTDANHPVCCILKFKEESFELVTVLNQTQYLDTSFDAITNSVRYDKVNSIMLEVKNTTKGTVDTNFLFYNNDTLKIKGRFYTYAIKVPMIDGQKYKFGDYAYTESNYVKMIHQ